MEPKIESSVSYDDRRKLMVQHFKSTQEIKMGGDVVGEGVMTRESTFNEEGIRNILKDLRAQQTNAEQRIKQLKESLKDVKDITPELIELEKKLQAINDFNKNKKVKTQLEDMETDLKTVKKDIVDIKDAIGTRLKL